MNRLKDKVAIVTGSGQGIGEGIARVFSGEGAKIVVVCRSGNRGEKVARELGSRKGNSIYVSTDVTDAQSVINMVDTTIREFGRIDILVNNAGGGILKNIEEATEEDWDYVIDKNLKSNFLCCKYCVPHLKKTRGNIINISSMTGHVGHPDDVSYSAAKGGQISMTKNLALDLARYGIRVNVICPGFIETEGLTTWYNSQGDPEKAKIFVSGQHPLGRTGTVEDCGKAALFLASDDAAFMTGSVLDIDGGITLGYPGMKLGNFK
jgi:NAD(P)-dependent dehydrogenase (short-subunit alcohol dehydrogenase family)